MSITIQESVAVPAVASLYDLRTLPNFAAVAGAYSMVTLASPITARYIPLCPDSTTGTAGAFWCTRWYSPPPAVDAYSSVTKGFTVTFQPVRGATTFSTRVADEDSFPRIAMVSTNVNLGRFLITYRVILSSPIPQSLAAMAATVCSGVFESTGTTHILQDTLCGFKAKSSGAYQADFEIYPGSYTIFTDSEYMATTFAAYTAWDCHYIVRGSLYVIIIICGNHVPKFTLKDSTGTSFVVVNGLLISDSLKDSVGATTLGLVSSDEVERGNQTVAQAISLTTSPRLSVTSAVFAKAIQNMAGRQQQKSRPKGKAKPKPKRN